MKAVGSSRVCTAAAMSSRAPTWCGVTNSTATSGAAPNRSTTSPTTAPTATAGTGCSESAAAKGTSARRTARRGLDRRQQGEGHAVHGPRSIRQWATTVP